MFIEIMALIITMVMIISFIMYGSKTGPFASSETRYNKERIKRTKELVGEHEFTNTIDNEFFNIIEVAYRYAKHYISEKHINAYQNNGMFLATRQGEKIAIGTDDSWMVDENLIISLDKLARRHSCCAIIYCRSYRSSDSMPDFHHDGYDAQRGQK